MIQRERIGQGYYQQGYGRGYKRKPIVYLIDGYAYARDSKAASECFEPLTGLLKGYVEVNYVNGEGLFYQCYNKQSTLDPHLPSKRSKSYLADIKAVENYNPRKKAIN